MMISLQDKRIWLIGASFGIGEKLAQQLSGKGAKLVISARSEDKLQALSGSMPAPCAAITCDVTSHESIMEAHEQAINTYDGLDMVIYNAGAYDPMSSADFNLARVEQVIDVNLHGAIRVLHTILPSMKAQESGTIALVGSVAGYRGLPKAMGYGLSKAAIIHLAENLRQDLDGTGIITQLINPGFVKTRLTDKNDFAMPMVINADQAATAIVKGLERQDYEIHFPKRFTWIMKSLAALPARLYFWVSNKVM